MKKPEIFFNEQPYSFNHNEKLELSKLFATIPPDIEYILFDEDLNILSSRIEEFSPSSEIDENFWKLLMESTDEFFYQTSSTTISGKKYYLISKFCKNHKNKNSSFTTILIAMLTIIVCVCIVILITIFFNITNSITNLENKTQSIADGNLSEKIDINGNDINEITSISNSLEKMRKSLLEAQNQKNKFLMGISHDLRTPVSIIKGYTEAILDGIIIEKTEVNKALELITAKTTQLESMIDTLINFMKLNSTDIRQKLVPESITELITNFAKEASITATVFRRNLKYSINFQKNICIPLDHQLVSRAFENLYNNALRYTKENDSIFINSYDDDEYIYFSIEDTGKGIEKEDLANIFNLFYRGTNSRREEGMGIGLSVVKNIVETHGWKISVESEIGEGSCFTILIPLSTATCCETQA